MCLILKSVYESCMNDINKMQETSLQVESQMRYNYKHIHFNLTCFNSDAVIKDL